MTTCEIEGCGRISNSQMNGIAVCERCGQDWESLGFGAVYFGQRWHGVIGATYTTEQAAACPGLITRETMTNEIQIDRSGVGHNWTVATADDLPEHIRQEIECEQIDGGVEHCDRYVASNGLAYRW